MLSIQPLWFFQGFLIFMVQVVPSWTSSACRSLRCRQAFAGIAWGSAYQGLILIMSSPHRNSSFGANVVAWLALVVLVIVRHVSAAALGTLKWWGVSTHSRVVEGTRHSWGDTARSWIERDAWVSLDLRFFCLLGLEGRVYKFLKFHSLLNLKHKGGK